MRLVWVRLVDDHRCTADFRARARGGRHGNDRGDAAFVGAGPVVADVFEIPDRARLAAHEGDELAHVQAAAATEGDHAIVVAGAPGVEAAGQVGFDRVGLEVAKQRDAQAGSAQGFQGGDGHRRTRQATVGDQQRALDALAAAGVGEFGDAADTKADARGVIPVRGQAHGSDLVAQMEGFGAGQVFITEARQGDAAPAVFHPGPGQGRVEVIAAVHEYGAGVDLIAQAFGGGEVLGPDRGAEPEFAVIHQGDGFVVASTGMMPTTGPKLSSRMTDI